MTLSRQRHCLIIVKRRPEKYSLQLATERRQRRCIPDRRRQAVPRTCQSHRELRHGHRVLNVWWTVPPAWLSEQSADDVDIVRCPEQYNTFIFIHHNSPPACCRPLHCESAARRYFCRDVGMCGWRRSVGGQRHECSRCHA